MKPEKPKVTQVYVCTQCEYCGSVHIDGSETVKQVIDLMDIDHKKRYPECHSESKRVRYRLVFVSHEKKEPTNLREESEWLML